MAREVAFYEAFRSQREIWGNGKPFTPEGLTLFLGLYNAGIYLSELNKQLSQQTDKNFQLLIVDNDSSDGTLEIVKGWLEDLSVPVQIVKNPVNIGFHGSLALNVDLALSPWLGFMNQDDVYLENHVQEIRRLISDSSPTTIAVSSQIGSISQSGENLPTPPRANWFFDQNYTQVELIAATIRQHIAPEPSIAYRTEILKLINSPWHSTAFPDTEILLEALTFGDVAFGEKETVLYRESPESASHHLNLKNRDQGAALGLARFFGGKNFESFCKDLSPRQRNQFASEVLDALEVRITEDEMLTFCKLFFIEMVCSIWGYSDSDSATLASNLNARTGNRRAAQTLKNVALFSDQASTKHERAHADIKKLGVKKRDFRRKILGGYKSFAKSTISKLNKREIIFLVKLLTRLGLLKAWKFPRKFDE